MKHLSLALTSLTILSGFLTGCGDGNSTTSNPMTPIAGMRLKQAGSDAQLITTLRQHLLEQYGVVHEFYPLYDTAVPTAPEATVAGGTPGSSTNVQESGVDEADRIKSNGQQLFVASSEKPALLVFDTDQASNRKIAELGLSTDNNALLTGLYLHDTTLTALSNSWNGLVYALSAETSLAEPAIMPPMYIPPAPSSQIFTVDVSQPANPRQLNQLSLDGETISSRMVGSTLYMATRYTPTLDGLTYPTTEEQAAANRDLINAAALEDFFPEYSVNGQAQGKLLSAADCFTTAYDASNGAANIISLLAIDTRSASLSPQGQCFIGDTETLYASTSAIYLATTQYQYQTDANGWLIYNGDVKTDLHKFALSGNTVSYRASGRINGHLGWQQDLKPFRLSEYQDTLRVVTYTGDNPDSGNSPAHLYNLQEDSATSSLHIVGQLPNANRPDPLGKPGEQIYATRLMGERGYLVTFRTTDPLYILDLSDPADPLIAGELQIDGYSDYLHPVSESLLLGIGKDAIATETDSTTGDSSELARGAWYQGVKLSLINISDPQHPVEQQTIVLGKRGTETAVTQTHHALTTLHNGNRLQVALPVSLHDTPESISDPDYTPDKPWYYYGWTQDELYTLNIDTDTGLMSPRPALVSEQRSTGNDYSTWQWPNDRSVMIGDVIHYLHGDKITSQNW